MILQELIAGLCDLTIDEKFKDLPIRRIVADSRRVVDGDLFVAVKGPSVNGARFIPDAIQKGAAVIVTEEDNPPEDFNEKVCYLAVEDTPGFLREISRRIYGDPSSQIKVIGVTGTNGKTTIAYLLEAIFISAGKKCGVIGTVNHRIGDYRIPAENTTPGFLENQELLNLMVDKGAQYCIMEVSSHALDQGRVDNIRFKAGVFTNLTQDHLDYHQDEERYFHAKSKLFAMLGHDSIAVINADDAYGQRLLQGISSPKMTFGLNDNPDVHADKIDFRIDGMNFQVTAKGYTFEIVSPMIGRHNVSNILAACAVALNNNIAVPIIQKAVSQILPVPGRLQRIPTDKGFSVFIDYAHTDDALRNVLVSLREVSPLGRIILVFGCGGERDRGKRPKMGRIAGEFADMVFITNDNPRHEDPQAIIDQIVPGFEKKNYRIIIDRKKAIREALKTAEENDIVLIAGKGHEDYQIIGDDKIPFNEEKIVCELLGSQRKRG